MFISPHKFAHVERLYDQSLYVRAYHNAQQIAPLEEWEGTTARILAGRIAATVGAPKLARKHQLLAYRHDPDDWETRYYYARMMLRYRGAIAAWQFLRFHDQDETLPTADPKVHSDWLAFHAFVLAQLRDFEPTETWLAKAEKVSPGNVWVWVERAKVFELQERYEDALSVLRYALILQPWFRPTIQTSAHALVLQGREEEALRLLIQASQHIECAWLVEQLAKLQIELGQFADARHSLERFAELSPRMEPEILEQLNTLRAEATYLSGNAQAASQYARQCTSPLQHQFAARVEIGEGNRVIFPVSAVRQSNLTGAAAALAIISQYYKIPVKQLPDADTFRADEIGAYTERKWAQQNGLAVREFRVTWENAIELLKRKIAFTIRTIDQTEVQVQAVIGYDSLRHTLIVPDLISGHHRELDARKFLDRYRGNGPHGMALLPAQHGKHLSNILLPETEQYDHLHALQEALEAQDRVKANSIYQTMQQRFDGHRLTLQAKLILAECDSDHAQMLACYEKLVELFPEDSYFKLKKAHCLRMTASRSKRLEYLQKTCKQKMASPLLWQEYALALSEDARQSSAALRWIQKTFRRGCLESPSVRLFADIRWQQQQQTEALELHRFATCLSNNDEQAAQSFFQAAIHLGQTEAALEFLSQRWQRQKTVASIQTLVQAFVQIGKVKEAFATLEAGLEWLPLEGKLKLFAAEMHARHGLNAQATSLLEEARAQVSSNDWLRTGALVATVHGQWSEALWHWLQFVEANPLCAEAVQHAAQLLSAVETPQTAIDFLRERLRRQPSANQLRTLLVERLRSNPSLAEPELRLMLKHDANNDWALRTLATVLLDLRRNEEALTVSETACRSNLFHPENQFVRGQVLVRLNRPPEATEAFRSAIKLSAEHAGSMQNLVSASMTLPEQREALRFLLQEIPHQPKADQALDRFRVLAKGILEPEELLQCLQTTLQQRPDLPLAWSAVVAQLLEMQRSDEAYALAIQATERFPLLARAWFDLALVLEAKSDTEHQIKALRRALIFDPGWVQATQKLAESCERIDQLAQARMLIERAITYDPLNYNHYGLLADILWKLGHKESALSAMQHALSLAPDYNQGWQTVDLWSEQLQRPSLAQECARALVEQRPGDPRVWFAVARTLYGNDVVSEQLTALDQALNLNPRFVEAYVLRASLLAAAGRYDEALRACRPSALAPDYPAELLSTEAFLAAQCGDLQLALKKMRTVLKDAPDYAPGWDHIARWYRTLEREKEYLEAARNLTRLQPQSAVAHGGLGEALLRNGDRDGAKAAFQQALALSAEYAFAGLTLFDLHVEDNNLRAAAEVLSRLEPVIDKESLALRALTLAIKTENQAQVQKHLVNLCLSPMHSTDLNNAVESVATTRLHKILDTVLEEVLAEPTVNPHVGKLWAERCALQNRPDHCLKRLHQMATSPGKLWHTAAATFLEICARNGATEHVQKFVRKYRNLLQQETTSWSAVGTAFYLLGDRQEMVEWMSNWQKRENVSPEMLWNLALALRDLHRDDEAREVGQFAVTLPEDDRTCSHLALLSLDEALAGRIRAADQHAAHITPHALNEWDRVMIDLATSLREFHTARAEGRAIGQAVIDRLMQLAQQTPWLKQSRTLVDLFKRAIESVLAKEDDSMLKVKTKLKMKWFEYRAN
ncbi:MAG: tetratricopeptide repeat protein [Acidobacteria bacterium]|nr:tetratricopeptide repeat protein [Acidobacteriota bacterium]